MPVYCYGGEGGNYGKCIEYVYNFGAINGVTNAHGNFFSTHKFVEYSISPQPDSIEDNSEEEKVVRWRYTLMPAEIIYKEGDVRVVIKRLPRMGTVGIYLKRIDDKWFVVNVG